MASNSGYGAAAERKVKAWYEQQGWYAARSAGSKGGADVVAWKVGPRNEVDLRLIQVKATRKAQYQSAREAEAYDNLADAYSERVARAFGEVWVWVGEYGNFRVTDCATATTHVQTV